MERNQNVQQNAQQGQQTVQDVFVKEKIMPHCVRIDELSVRCDDIGLDLLLVRKILDFVVTGIFESSSPLGKRWRTRGCTHLRSHLQSLFFLSSFFILSSLNTTHAFLSSHSLFLSIFYM